MNNSNTSTLSQSQSSQNISLPKYVAEATGSLPYTLTNDYLFRALFQENTHVLKGLICSLLHLQPEEISSIKITNPIVLGKAISDKEFILDIHIILNNNAHINLEMQVLNDGNWPERSLGYLCRTFDNLNKGDDYIDTKSAIHIGFLDFHLFPEHPEFYATYKLMNVKNNTIYSDKFTLSVVDLNYIKLATSEDREYQIDYWAALFKATTWEEIKMLAENNTYIQEATETIYQLNANAAIREQCEARNAYYARERHHAKIQKAYEEATAQLEIKNAEIANKDAEIANKDAEIADKNAEIASKDAENNALKKELATLKAQLAQMKF